MAISPMALDSLDLARWQFGITTVYHFILVPLTIGLSPLVALMETLWRRTGNKQWLVATKFFGKILLINFALGVATGIVQEFQFGMNWSEYSRFVGNIFGAPLAFEALLAFFMESVFLGLWIFGWDRLSPRLHNLCMWAVAAGTNFSAFFILTANSWMQHPVGAVVNPKTGRAELDGVSGFLKLLSNELVWATVLHVISSALLVAAAVVMGVSVWWMVKAAQAKQDFEARELWRRHGGRGPGHRRHRPHAGSAGRRVPAGQDGRCRGAVPHRGRSPLHRGRLRGLQERGRHGPVHLGSRCLLLHGHQ